MYIYLCVCVYICPMLCLVTNTFTSYTYIYERIEPKSPTLQTDSLPSEPPGKPKNTRVGSLSLLVGIFPTQELNRGLLHCRQIL